jgi:hypothetical protein
VPAVPAPRILDSSVGFQEALQLSPFPVQSAAPRYDDSGQGHFSSIRRRDNALIIIVVCQTESLEPGRAVPMFAVTKGHSSVGIRSRQGWIRNCIKTLIVPANGKGRSSTFVRTKTNRPLKPHHLHPQKWLPDSPVYYSVLVGHPLVQCHHKART